MASDPDPNVITVTIKWARKDLPPVDIDLSESPAVFKSQLWTLTGVPPDRQTVLGFSGGKLKDDAEWAAIKPKPGTKVILMGTPDENRLAPPTKLPTVHDDLDVDASDPAYQPPPSGPPGLVNLGNTCYMNATIQCLHAVPPLLNSLTSFRGSTAALNPAEKLAASLRDVLSRLRSANTASVSPRNFLAILREVNPRFAERDNRTGEFMQQDAEECLGELLTRMKSALTLPGDAPSNQIDRLFSFQMSSRDECEETGEALDRKEMVQSLKCHISISVSHLARGITDGLTEDIEKHSDELDRSAVWKRTSRMLSLPPFLIVQFVRFYWKQAEAVKAKILRKVSFPLTLDVHDFCSDELKEKLSKKRDEVLQKEEATNAAQADGEAASSSEKKQESAPELPFSDDDGSSVFQADTGYYELAAVLTHRGRALDSGHYVAWVKDKGSRWYQFDDDKVTIHNEEELKKLQGGGMWHMAYMCLYRAKKV